MNNPLDRLKRGNEAYVKTGAFSGDVSEKRRTETASGQKPYAVVLTCADSRVAPEVVFSAGVGELFVVRNAGNVVTDAVLGSVEYAVEHLGVELVVVLGHTRCGAVDAAVNHEPTGYTKILTDAIRKAIGEEKNLRAAAGRNAIYGANKINGSLKVRCAIPAVYDVLTGEVEFI